MNFSFETIYKTAAGFQEASILFAAAELDVFTVILQNGNAVSAPQLSSLCRTDIRGTAALLDALAAMEYLKKTGEEPDALYTVPAEKQDLLDSRNPATMIPILRHNACCQRRWAQLSFAVRDGRPPEPQESFLGKEQDQKSFIMGMNSIAVNLADAAAESLKQAGAFTFAQEPIRFIDIGGASGTYTEAFLRALPQSQGTLFDLPVGIAAARRRFTGSEYEQRVQLIEGDFYVDEFPSGFDWAWISAIIHQFDRTESRKLYQKAFRSLGSGGKIAVRDFVLHPSRTAPRAGVIFGINMLVATPTGRVYSFEEIKEDLEASGFTDVKLTVPAETMSAVVTAKK